jgi:hypothetical protein
MVMADQHASLTPDRWSKFSLDEQILMIANEMNRARKLLAQGDAHRLAGAYERILQLTDLTVCVHSRRALRRELLRWRDLVAALYVAESPVPDEHDLAFRCLLTFTPRAYLQTPHVLGAPSPAKAGPRRTSSMPE